jgi:DNA primase
MLEEIKRSLTMQEIACFYGFKPNRQNYIPCPFHSEKTASLRLYDKSFYCFGCGTGGDLIKFVQLYFNISFAQALIRINSDFRLGLTDKKPVHSRPVQRKPTPEELYETEYNEKWEEYHELLWAREKLKPKSDDEALNPLFVKSLQKLEHLQAWLDMCDIPK